MDTYNAIAPGVVRGKSENAFKPATADFIFALAVFALGYIFSRWVLFSWRGWGVAAFTLAYIASVTLYLAWKNVLVKNIPTFFWMAATLITGASYMLWDNFSLSGNRALFLFLSAVYYVMVASGRLVTGKTGNYLFFDGINATVIVPFRNLINQYVSFSVLGRGGKGKARAVPIVIGAAIAAVMIIILTPLLRSADSGGFGALLDSLAEIFSINWDKVGEVMFYGFFTVPVAAYIYGLVSGVAHKKGTDVIKPEGVRETVATLRVTPVMTVYVALGAVLALYLVFILSQLPYFFSAFTGKRPEGWLIYSQYARRGFFELCGIAVINLGLVTLAGATCKKQSNDGNRLLKAFNIAYAAVTLVLIATAFSKMALYIDAYGLTMQRLLPCLFMVFLAAVFVALIILQSREFSIVRFALVLGSLMLCCLFLSNPDAFVVRYNTDRYLNGTLHEYDTGVLYRARYAGVLPALEVLEKTSDVQVKDDIMRYLNNFGIYPMLGLRVHDYSIESRRALDAISVFLTD